MKATGATRDESAWHDSEHKREHQTSYNVKPTHIQPILVRSHSELQYKYAKWGITLSGTNMIINARSDSIDAGKPLYKGLREKNRCVVLAQGYYEWKTTAHGK